jgi:hypothetical protein
MADQRAPEWDESGHTAAILNEPRAEPFRQQFVFKEGHSDSGADQKRRDRLLLGNRPLLIL